MFFASPLLKTAVVSVSGEPATMACTLLALYRFEQATGTRTPPPNRVTTRALIWALLATFQPALTVRDVGAMDAAEYRAAMAAATTLIASPGGKPAAAQGESTEPPGWLQVWSVGRFDLGLTDAEFWQLSPAQFDALWKRLEDGRTAALRGHAMTCAAIFNAQRTTDDAPVVEADDFMPKTPEQLKAAEQKQRAAERASLKAKLASVASILGAQKI